MTETNAETLLNLSSFFPFQLSVLEKQVSESIAQYYAVRFQLTRYEWRVMAALAMHQSMSAKDVANFTRLDKMQVSRAISVLKESELINQQKSATDRRISELTLTAKGQALYSQIVPLVIEQEQKILAILSEQEQQQLQQLMEKLSLHAESLIHS
ncbi:DNA-binding transcriptional regulator, MarR family [Oceanospirillum multiglobuliferum]|uniref:HTH marR-type domain-containing protein n=1 Tax=Oceanospirillum multiglobuliferum TaxID=64969 RepID=A0A1T4S7V2_9GAMM|nr:MarR family transcriptional regulator [Oceanospirillum multiglobuliferum]OPX54427.1 hypothetical protein BTE48_14450 [Oceanospirillum multiglobuliferum]SKA23911.1 DNA-binding transcriptional regulator, MarR family [Oceanospirillum multiglobuliferum]